MERCTQALRALGMALDRDGGVGKRYTGPEWSIYGFMMKGGGLTRASCLNGWKTGTTISCGATGEKFVPVDGRRFVDY